MAATKHNPIHYFFHHLKLKQKLLTAFFVLLIIPLGILYLFTYSKITSILEHNIYYSTSQNFEQTYSFLSYKFYKIIKSSDVIFIDEKVHALSNINPLKYDEIAQIDDMNKLQSFLSSFEDKEDIQRVRLYVPDGFIFSDENLNLFNIQKVANTTWVHKLSKTQNKILFCPSEYLESQDPQSKNLLSVARVITDLNDYSKTDGLLRMDIDKNNILEILKKANPIKNSFTFIENSDGILVVSSNAELQSQYNIYYKTIKSHMSGESNLQSITIKGEKYFAVSKAIPNTDWFMTTIVPNVEILEEINSQRNSLLIIILIISVCAYMMAYTISYYMTRRIDTLVVNMQAVPSGVFTPIDAQDDQDEIGLLIHNYNYMLNTITNLMDEQYTSGQLLKTAELKAIQAQINPHFLYNTLEMINWMAKKQKTEDILAVTKALSQFYKLSLNKGKDFIRLEDELLHVKAYVSIQNMRFNNKILFQTEIAPELTSYIVPKIILQPIVENAITHGILEKENQEGILQIRVYEETTSIHAVVIEIHDDGVGISPEKLEKIRHPQPTTDTHNQFGSHYGIQNIGERLNLMYNNQCQLIYESTLGLGTTVRIVLPIT